MKLYRVIMDRRSGMFSHFDELLTHAMNAQGDWCTALDGRGKTVGCYRQGNGVWTAFYLTSSVTLYDSKTLAYEMFLKELDKKIAKALADVEKYRAIKEAACDTDYLSEGV